MTVLSDIRPQGAIKAFMKTLVKCVIIGRSKEIIILRLLVLYFIKNHIKVGALVLYRSVNALRLTLQDMKLPWSARLRLLSHYVTRILRFVVFTVILRRRKSPKLPMTVELVLEMMRPHEILQSESSLIYAAVSKVDDTWLSFFFPLYARIAMPGIRTEEDRVGPVPARWVHTGPVERWSMGGLRNSQSIVVLYFLHGGGYIFLDGVHSHLEYCARLVAKTQQEFDEILGHNVAPRVVGFIIDYRKAPQYVFPTAVEDAVNGYAYLLSKDSPYPVASSTHILVCGDSAGGGLSISMAIALSMGYLTPGGKPMPLPGAMGVCSPFLDLRRAIDNQAYEPSICYLTDACIWMSADLYLFGDAQNADPECPPADSDFKAWRRARSLTTDVTLNPLASPLHADLSCLRDIPIIVQAGGSEGLLVDTLALARRAKVYSLSRLSIEIYTDMFHIFPMFARLLPSGMVAVNRMSKFLAKRLCLALKGVTVTPTESPMVSSTVSVVEQDGAMQKRRISAWKSNVAADLTETVLGVTPTEGPHSESLSSDDEEPRRLSRSLKTVVSVPYGCHRIVASPEVSEDLCRYHLKRHSSTPDCSQEGNTHNAVVAPSSEDKMFTVIRG
ncbi:hypothetical protein FOL47_008018 [Perkinsus chesapeaki]|uniref:Alpha/beta hydrolase fold-3 domain-containing protein n=1 Tax=Perkinsus chesapeaki TaxID=330153 RepID=A0A7J6LGC7_PERCH|nr:hypothetical protein FOL47_008018 [Perkinsus chesapeaki]